MHTQGNSPVASVASIDGKVFVQQEDGSRRLLKRGDKVYEGDIVIAENGSKAVLRAENGSIRNVEGNQSIRLSAAQFSDDNRLDVFGEETSGSDRKDSGKTVQGDDQHHGFVRVERIDETLGETPYRFTSLTGGYDPSLEGRNSQLDAFLDGRATHDPRIVMGFSPIEPLEREEAKRIYPEFISDKRIRNTVPKIGVPEDREVREEHVETSGSTGTDPDQELVQVTGSLGVVYAGESLDTTFFETASLPVLYSDGQQLVYEISNDGHTLVASTDKGATIFTVDILNPNDRNGGQSYRFELFDQLDHDPLQGEGVTIPIEFSFLVKDQSGDTLTGTFTVTVYDDTPIVTESDVSGKVWEDALSTSAGELSDGNPDGDEGESSTAASIGRGGSGEPLTTLVTVGADDPPTFGFSSTESSEIAAVLGELKSADQDLSYRVTDMLALDGVTVIGQRLAGYVAGTPEREVFTLDVYKNGEWDFHLNDQLDHSDASGDDGLLTIDFTGILQATDADGDTVAFEQERQFFIDVENDIPSQTTGIAQGYVEEEALSGGNQDTSDITGIDGDSAYNTNNAVWQGTLSGLFSAGADQPG
ncbi:MAG: hypothetical protein K4305_03675, partial [Chlorobium sp.]